MRVGNAISSPACHERGSYSSRAHPGFQMVKYWESIRGIDKSKARYDSHADIWARNNSDSPFLSHPPFPQDRVLNLWIWVIARVGLKVDILNHILFRPEVCNEPLLRVIILSGAHRRNLGDHTFTPLISWPSSPRVRLATSDRSLLSRSPA